MMGKRVMDAVDRNEDSSVHGCVKEITLLLINGQTYKKYECRTHSMTACSVWTYHKCKEVKHYIPVIGRVLTDDCVCAT